MHPLVKTFVVSIGMMTDAYEIFLMNICYVIIKEIYGETSYSSTLSSAVLVGMAIGQLLFGVLADTIGKKLMFITTLTILIIFSILQAFSFEVISGAGPYIILAVIRFILGLGIGGEYPLSSSIASEDAKPHNRGRKLVFIFSMQGIGNILAPLVVLILLYTPLKLDYVWRTALALGAVPCILTLYHRVIMDMPKKKKDHVTSKSEVRSLIKKNWFYLFGTAGCWFFFDIAFYGNSMFNSTVLQVIGFGPSADDEDPRDGLISTTIGNLILVLMAFPGFIVSFLLVDRIGRKPLQLFGFAGTAICFFLMAFFEDIILEHVPYLFVIIYGLSFFFQNMGPNTTTYINAAETYDPRIRGTFNGLSAASGKIGAMIGTAVFNPFTNSFGQTATFCTCGALMMVGFGLSFIVPEGKGADIEQIADSYQQFDEETNQK
ncbi:phosphate transporter, putative [Entamoeba histolytica HM-1:IMSS-B]|uniref:Phosphate transporter, putative n=6 Tax=Entamoeba histolytica TaxID=5759 RepID=C4LYD9_ENTH1|nr:phosphate transporter, putative [Entamoeba histolytica HM-1:IMSS]EMD43319.1 inorganic phosphate transporter, putative [Entamoeba histolytica KU27]EMH74337.1 phosphate transporter, putative [Entamoeba histolytica HM-1:IMSS-B]EMS14310.1 inorganic phosphate transporter, putative [Entamoeba histolytica HM-3:IMSS]ENY61982.1 inorganic phosphate transporter, putative [Entamoeba histolytica HM-1:IMSS-A]GAT93832.1 phosphate transporter putative [Entamoeba histolytica]|eukprot:XP_654379.1 phosphate transporter, putative [Entamoeba histolytica HM-1:IMSS]